MWQEGQQLGTAKTFYEVQVQRKGESLKTETHLEELGFATRA